MPSMIREFRMKRGAPKAVREFAETALMNIAAAHDSIIEHRTLQTFHANKHRSDEPELREGELVYLSTKNLKMPTNRARKLCPRFIGPYKVLSCYPEKLSYTIELPTALQKRRIHPTFHVSLLRPYIASDDMLFPNRATPGPYDFGTPDEDEWFVEEIIGHRWTNKKLELQVRWSLGDTTWEWYDWDLGKLDAMDRYLDLFGIKSALRLPKRNKNGLSDKSDSQPTKRR